MNSQLAKLKAWFFSLREKMISLKEEGLLATSHWEFERRENCTVYTGVFMVRQPGRWKRRQVHGRIVEWPGLPTDVYVYNPPLELRHHAKGPCLQLLSPDNPWFKLHWEKPAQDFATSFAYVERLLTEALKR